MYISECTASEYSFHCRDHSNKVGGGVAIIDRYSLMYQSCMSYGFTIEAPVVRSSKLKLLITHVLLNNAGW